MRLLHPKTLQIVATICKDSDFTNATVSRKQVISHAWSEVLKYKATNQMHPKVFIKDDEDLGIYMSLVYKYGEQIGCKFNVENIMKYDLLYIGFCGATWYRIYKYFDDCYLFSDAVSLYLKGLNIFQYIYGDEWRKFVPIENLKEIQRIVNKTLDNRKGKMFDIQDEEEEGME